MLRKCPVIAIDHIPCFHLPGKMYWQPEKILRQGGGAS